VSGKSPVIDHEAIMTTVLWVLGVWLLASLPVALLIGGLCSLNDLEGEERWIGAPPADQEKLSGLTIAA
jgi:hypothetical protein